MFSHVLFTFVLLWSYFSPLLQTFLEATKLNSISFFPRPFGIVLPISTSFVPATEIFWSVQNSFICLSPAESATETGSKRWGKSQKKKIYLSQQCVSMSANNKQIQSKLSTELMYCLLIISRRRQTDWNKAPEQENPNASTALLQLLHRWTSLTDTLQPVSNLASAPGIQKQINKKNPMAVFYLVPIDTAPKREKLSWVTLSGLKS